MINKKKFFWVIGIIIILSLSVVLNLSLLKPKKSVLNPVMLKYKIFETKNPAIDFTFDYPETGWIPQEAAGNIERYDLVYLQGPVDEETKFTTLIDVTIRPLEAGKAAVDLLNAYLKIDSNLTKFQASHEESMDVGGREAASALCEYESSPTYQLTTSLTLFKKRMVFVVKDDRSYEFTLVTIASQYDAYAPILEHVLKTFKFKS